MSKESRRSPTRGLMSGFVMKKIKCWPLALALMFHSVSFDRFVLAYVNWFKANCSM